MAAVLPARLYLELPRIAEHLVVRLLRQPRFLRVLHLVLVLEAVDMADVRLDIPVNDLPRSVGTDDLSVLVLLGKCRIGTHLSADVLSHGRTLDTRCLRPFPCRSFLQFHRFPVEFRVVADKLQWSAGFDHILLRHTAVHKHLHTAASQIPSVRHIRLPADVLSHGRTLDTRCLRPFPCRSFLQFHRFPVEFRVVADKLQWSAGFDHILLRHTAVHKHLHTAASQIPSVRHIRLPAGKFGVLPITEASLRCCKSDLDLCSDRKHRCLIILPLVPLRAHRQRHLGIHAIFWQLRCPVRPAFDRRCRHPKEHYRLCRSGSLIIPHVKGGSNRHIQLFLRHGKIQPRNILNPHETSSSQDSEKSPKIK